MAAILDLFSPDPKWENPELRLRLRVVLLLFAISAGASLVGAGWLVLEGLYSRAVMAFALAAVFGLEPFLLRQAGSLTLLAHIHGVVLSLGLGALLFTSGAQTMPPFLLAAFVPVSAALIAGPRVAVVWLGVTLLGLCLLYLLVVGGYAPRPFIDEVFLLRGRFFGAGLVAGVMSLVTILYEQTRTRRLRDLEQAHESLERVRRDQLELRDRFVSHVAHELRTPLSSLHMAVAGLGDSDSLVFNAEQRDYLDIAQRNATQLGRMIGDLTEMMRAEAGKLLIEREPISLEETSAWAVQEQEAVAARRDVTLRADAEAGLPPVLADPTRVRQVLNNLIENAVKFSPRGGEVVVRVCREPGDDAFARLSVEDQGIGIAAGELERIFDRMHQAGAESASPGGLGLGLAICQEIVTCHGGRIWAESRLAAGSTFHFTLPRALEVGRDEPPSEPDPVRTTDGSSDPRARPTSRR